jgi:hypothetical protein
MHFASGYTPRNRVPGAFMAQSRQCKFFCPLKPALVVGEFGLNDLHVGFAMNPSATLVQFATVLSYIVTNLNQRFGGGLWRALRLRLGPGCHFLV